MSALAAKALRSLLPAGMSDAPPGGFSTLADLEAAASRRATPEAWNYVQAGAIGEDAMRANRAAFGRRTLRPRALVDVSSLDLRTQLLDDPVAVPFYVCPMARQALLHPDGEVATARAAGAAAVLSVQSTLSSRTPPGSKRRTTWHSAVFSVSA